MKHNEAAFKDTERISLVSSYMCSLLLGDYAAIDTSDGAGMNMMDLTAQVVLDTSLQCFPR